MTQPWQQRMLNSSLSEQQKIVTPSDSISSVLPKSSQAPSVHEKVTLLNSATKHMLLQGTLGFIVTFFILAIVRPPFVTTTKNNYNTIVWKTICLLSLVAGVVVAFFPWVCKL